MKISKTLLGPTLLFVFSLVLRLYKLKENLFFGPEQGIDFLAVKSIVLDHRITLIGSTTDVGGVFHGPAYYYFLSILFAITKGNPLYVEVVFVILNALGIFLIYQLGKEIINRRVGIIAALIYSVSFGAIVYSHWLMNPPLAILTAGLFILFMQRYLKGSDRDLILAAVFFGLTAQIAFLNIFFMSFLTLVLIIFNFKRFKTTNFLYLIGSLFLAGFITFGTYILFDIRHQFLITKAITNLATGKKGYHQPFLSSANETVNVFLDQFSTFTAPFAGKLFSLVIIASAFAVAFIKRNSKVLILLIWVLAPLISLIILSQGGLEQFFSITVMASILILSFLIETLLGNIKYLIAPFLIVIIALNLFSFKTGYLDSNKQFFQAPQPNLKFSDQEKIIEQTYRNAGGKDFSFQPFTLPYWLRQEWDYLFWYYGENKYGYLPKSSGGQFFVITQQTPGNTGTQRFEDNWLINDVSKQGQLKKLYISGILSLYKVD